MFVSNQESLSRAVRSLFAIIRFLIAATMK